MIFAKDFFALQLTFAERVAELAQVPRERALLDYTNLYVRFGLGREFDEQQPVWRAYLAGLRAAGNVCDYTHEFYLGTAGATTAPLSLGKFGCFSWACEEQQRIRLHFVNNEPGHISPLSTCERDMRLSELGALFAHVKAVVGDAARVVGVSWLYNLEAYRRLFPPGYGESRRRMPARFRGMSLWGQFLDHRGELKRTAVDRLLESVGRQSSIEEVERCFPLQVLTTEGPVQQFYSFYGL
jgi:hypothetical protein